MKYFIYVALIFFGCLLFIPESGSTQIRNFPILLIITSCIALFYLFLFLKYIALMIKTIKKLQQHGVKNIRLNINPFACSFRGYYGMLCESEDFSFNIVFLIARKKYQHYHFEDIHRLEFYRSNRVVFQNIKTKGATVSKLVETNLVGKRKIKWNVKSDSAKFTNVLLFDKMPYEITDSVNRSELVGGNRICDTDTYLYDLDGFFGYIENIEKNEK